jgi:CheY-like chemotaxis protein
MVRELFRLNLETCGFEVTTAATGTQGLERALEMVPDIIILDIRMPGINGWETYGSFKLFPETKNIPVILLTAYSNAQDRDRARHLGASLFLTKPVDPQVLADVIRDTLAPKHEQAEHRTAVS